VIRAMRENLKVLSVSLWIVIAAFVATTFFVWGKGSITGGNGTVAITVNGEDVSLAQYQQLYRASLESYQQTFKDRLNDEMVRQLRLPERVANDLIQERLLLQWATRDGIRVGDEELLSNIWAMPIFHEDGRFSLERYRRVLAANRLDDFTFQTRIRTGLIKQKVETLILDGIKLSEAEVRDAWVLARERVRAQYLLIETAPLIPTIQVSDAELQKSYEERQAQFRRPEQRRVQHAILSSKTLRAQVSVTDQELEAYYRDHPREFEQPKRIRVAHILVRVPSTGGSEAEAEAKGKLEGALKRIKGGADFAQLAKEVSEDPASAAQGGDVGYVTEGELVKSFERAAFALKKCEISEPVRTEYGYHLIKLLDVQAPEKKGLRDVKGTIRDKLTSERADRLAQSRAQALQNALSGAPDFKAEAGRQGVEVRESPFFSRGTPLEGVGQVPEMEEAIWGLAVGGTTPFLKTPSGYVIARLVEKRDAFIPPLAEVREAVLMAVKREKAQARAVEQATTMIAALQKGEDLQSLARRENLKAGETGFFSRVTPMADKDLAQELGEQPFLVKTGGVSNPIIGRRGVYLLKVVERQPPDPIGFEAARAELEKQLLTQKRTQAWQGWTQALRAQAKIEINEKVIGTLAP